MLDCISSLMLHVAPLSKCVSIKNVRFVPANKTKIPCKRIIVCSVGEWGGWRLLVLNFAYLDVVLILLSAISLCCIHVFLFVFIIIISRQLLLNLKHNFKIHFNIWKMRKQWSNVCFSLTVYHLRCIFQRHCSRFLSERFVYNIVPKIQNARRNTWARRERTNQRNKTMNRYSNITVWSQPDDCTNRRKQFIF